MLSLAGLEHFLDRQLTSRARWQVCMHSRSQQKLVPENQSPAPNTESSRPALPWWVEGRTKRGPGREGPAGR